MQKKVLASSPKAVFLTQWVVILLEKQISREFAVVNFVGGKSTFLYVFNPWIENRGITAVKSPEMGEIWKIHLRNNDQNKIACGTYCYTSARDRWSLETMDQWSVWNTFKIQPGTLYVGNVLPWSFLGIKSLWCSFLLWSLDFHLGVAISIWDSQNQLVAVIAFNHKLTSNGSQWVLNQWLSFVWALSLWGRMTDYHKWLVMLMPLYSPWGLMTVLLFYFH